MGGMNESDHAQKVSTSGTFAAVTEGKRLPPMLTASSGSMLAEDPDNRPDAILCCAICPTTVQGVPPRRAPRRSGPSQTRGIPGSEHPDHGMGMDSGPPLRR